LKNFKLRKMKKILFILLAAVSLTSCLKDKPNTDFSGIGTVIELPWAGLQYFTRDAITDLSDTVTVSFGINIASAKTLSTATNYTLAVDNSLTTAYIAANPGINYLPLPAGSYNISKLSGTIAAGQRLDSVKVTIYRNQLDPASSYMLPIKLASASNGTLSGNFNAHYYHMIGNDFAGSYLWDYTRIPASGNFVGNAATLSPINPTEFSAFSGYYTGLVQYDVTFTKTGSGATAVYTNFHVVLDPATVASQLTANSITVTVPASFKSSGTADLAGPYTYAQAITLFDFQYAVVNSSGGRAVEDRFYKP
jgi:hypothetical protein